MTKDLNLSTSTLDSNKALAIRKALTNFFQRCGLESRINPFVLDEAFYKECCKEAINCGIPMDGKYSIRAYMPTSVAMVANSYSHLHNHETSVWICLLFSTMIGFDDHLHGALDMEHVSYFNERFFSCQPQGNPALKAFDTLLRMAPRHYSPLVSNLITTSILDFTSSLLLDEETKDMQVSTQTPLFPEYSRILSGFAAAAIFFIFDPKIPIRDYIQAMPDLISVTNFANDIMSFYKEELAGETVNYLSLMATTRSATKMDAMHETIDRTVQAHHNVLESLKAHTDAYSAYVSFFHGYIKYYTSTRYRLEEIMLKAE